MRIAINKRQARSVAITLGTTFVVVALASVALASGGGEGGHHVDTAKQMKDFGWRVVDFIALVGIIVWALKKANVKSALAERREGIEKALAEAREARTAAEKKLAEYTDKLAKANQEIDEIYAAIKKEGELEKERIIAEAKAAAAKISEQAGMTAAQEVQKARAELREEAARLAVQLATQTLKDAVKKDDQDRLVGEYLNKVVELH